MLIANLLIVQAKMGDLEDHNVGLSIALGVVHRLASLPAGDVLHNLLFSCNLSLVSSVSIAV